jgi:hypothetical protein
VNIFHCSGGVVFPQGRNTVAVMAYGRIDFDLCGEIPLDYDILQFRDSSAGHLTPNPIYDEIRTEDQATCYFSFEADKLNSMENDICGIGVISYEKILLCLPSICTLSMVQCQSRTAVVISEKIMELERLLQSILNQIILFQIEMHS